MRRRAWIALLLLALAEPLRAAAPLAVVPELDLTRYVGLWHEIARLPNRFQTQCVGEVTATYRLREDGMIGVVNACRLADGRVDRAEGVARRARPDGPNSRLEVRFAPAWLAWLPLVWGDYWVIELGADYGYAVVGTPDRKYLWILARAPQMEETLYRQILARAEAQGFPVLHVVRSAPRD